MDWPPPYEGPAVDIPIMSEDEIMDLPDLPPPPFFYPNEDEQKPQDSEHLGEMQSHSTSTCSVPSRVTHVKLSPKPPTSFGLIQQNPSLLSSPKPPPKPTKFPVSLHVPVSPGDRRPSSTSQYDNLSEADEEDHYLEGLLASTPEEIHRMHSYPSRFPEREYDPVHNPLPPPLVFIPPSPSHTPPTVSSLPSLPQEPEYGGEDRWVEDSIMPPPPPSFADRLPPFQCSTARCPDTHRTTSPTYPKPISRAPRDHSAFPAPLLYTGSPSGHTRPSGQPAVGMPMVRSSPDFCRMPPGGQQLPKSVTF